MENVNELLVAAVEKRTALYDKTEDNYSNRVFINKQWIEIGNELGIDGTLLKISFVLAILFNGRASSFDSFSITSMLQRSLDCHQTPGMSVAVVRDGQVLYEKGFGHTNLAKLTPVTENTLFGIASISKSFAAALLVKLLDEKTDLTLNSKVKELLGDKFVMPDEVRTEQTTFLDLLAHKTSLLSNNKIRYDTDFNRDTLLRRLRDLPSDKQFRVDFIYNNIVYGLVGRLAEIIDGTGKRWEELVAEHFFTPLGMTKSTFLTRFNYSTGDYAEGFMERNGPDMPERVTPMLSKKWSEVCASGAVMSTAKEMTEWMLFHLQEGKNSRQQEVMKSELVKEMHKPQFIVTPLKYLDIEQPTFPITAYTGDYGLGLRVGHYRGNEYIYHTGTTFGYSALMALLPTRNIGVTVLINNSDKQFRQRAAIMHYLLDNALGIWPYIDDSTICSYPSPWVDTSTLTYTYPPKATNVPLQFSKKEYEGKYNHNAFGKLEIEFDNNSLFMNYGWGIWELLVWPDVSSSTTDGTPQEQRLYGKGSGPIFPADMYPFHFISHPDDDNIVIGLRGNGFERKRPPIFCKEGHTDVCADLVKATYPEAKEELTC